MAAGPSLASHTAALGSLAVVAGRARSRREVAEAALERLCELTVADAAVIVTWSGGRALIEASRGIGEELGAVIRNATAEDLVGILEPPARSSTWRLSAACSTGPMPRRSSLATA